MTDTPATSVDRTRLEALADEIGDRDIVHQAVQSFLDELVERLQAIRTAIAGGDPAVIKKAAHALGSPAAMLGAQQVMRICRDMEARCEVGTEILSGLMADLDAAAAQTVSELRGYLDGR